MHGACQGPRHPDMSSSERLRNTYRDASMPPSELTAIVGRNEGISRLSRGSQIFSELDNLVSPGLFTKRVSVRPRRTN
jgi:hypothetical protein